MDRRNLLFGALAIGASGALPLSAFAAKSFNPPLWIVRKGSAKVYLFGEMFADRNFGSSPKIVGAFNESGEFWKETPPLNPREYQALLIQFGRVEIPLTERLGAADATRLLAMTAAIKAPAESFEPCRPWLAVQQLQGPVYQSLGVTVQQDAGVSAAAKTANKPTRYEFADGPTLVRYFSEMSAEAERQYLLSLLATFQAGRDAWAKRPEAWAVGDLSVEEEVLQRQAKDFPAYFACTAARNRAWVPRIQTMLEGNHTSFIRMGFDHLLGPDSVPYYLRQAGLKVELSA